MASLSDIRAQIEALKNQEMQILNSEKNAVVAEIRNKIAEFGLTASDLGFSGAGRRSASPAAKSTSAAAVKYRDGSNTWSGGRGPKPKWIKAKIEAGENIEKYKV